VGGLSSAPEPLETDAPTAEAAPAAALPQRGAASIRGASPDSTVRPAPTPAALRAEALAKGAATKKSDGPEGTEALLAPRHLQRIERLACVPGLDATAAAITGPAAPLARALFWKAAAARSDALLGADPCAKASAEAALQAFARSLGGLDDATLRARATVVDLDSRINSSTWDPAGLDAKKNTFGNGGADDYKSNNDGLFQRFTATCGSTTLEILLCEEDPVRAFARHEAGIHSSDTAKGALSADFQRETLERYGGVAVSKKATHCFLKLKHEMGVVRRSGAACDKDVDALGRYVRREGPLDAAAQRALAAVRARADGFPLEADIAEIHAAKLPRKDEGLGYDEFARAIADVLTPVTGVKYEQTAPPDGFGRGKAGPHLEDVAAALRKGVDVPVGMTDPAHWLLLSAVSGKAPARRFLMSDPDRGATAWVTEKDLVSGAFARSGGPFDLSDKKKLGFIDSFYLPAKA